MLADFMPPGFFFDFGLHVWAEAKVCDDLDFFLQQALQRRTERHEIIKSGLVELDEKVHIAVLCLFASNIGAEQPA